MGDLESGGGGLRVCGGCFASLEVFKDIVWCLSFDLFVFFELWSVILLPDFGRFLLGQYTVFNCTCAWFQVVEV